MRFLAFVLVLSIAACATPARTAAPQKLYLALEVRRDGRLVGKPKLLGETGKSIRVERREPGATSADYQLALVPSENGRGSFKLDLDLALPGAAGHSQLELLHGEERKIELGARPGELEVTLMLMKVDSSEFRALMSLAGSQKHRPGSI